ncbi:MAG: glycosyltransferase [Planctomycetota bacterium]
MADTQRMKTLAFVIDDIGDGGVGNVVLRLSRALRARGFRVPIIALRARQGGHVHALQPGDDVHVLLPTRLRFCSVLRRRHEARHLARTLRSLAPDGDTRKFQGIVGFKRNALRALHASRIDHANVHYSLRSSIFGSLETARSRSLWRYLRVRNRLRSHLNGKSLLCVSKGIENELAEYSIDAKRAATILNPYDFKHIRALADEPIPMPETEYIVHVGRDDVQKRIDVLLEAFRLVREPVSLVLVGTHSDRLPSLVARMGLSDRVHLVGFQQNPFPWMRRARLLVLSSDYEGCANVLVESLICGTPVVSTNCPCGPSEILTGDLACGLVPRRDPKALAAAIDDLLNSPPDVSRAEVFERVDINQACDGYLAACGIAPA